MNLLIVDDEIITVKGILKGVNWEALSFDQVFSCTSAKEAKVFFQENAIDILLSDIEMPQESGLKLLEWVRENGYDTECVFLTCHDKFDFAQRALKLDGLDYLLKPVPYEDLQQILSLAIDKVEKQKLSSRYQEYGKNQLNQYGGQIEQDERNSKVIVQELKTYIDSHLQDDLTADFLAKIAYSALQMLLARCYQSMAAVRGLLGMDATEFETLFRQLTAATRKYFWDDELGAYIDSCRSGRRKVSRHPNIFAVLFDYCDADQVDSILKNVLFNDAVSAITTPYFKFYELETLAKLGRQEMVLDTIKDYWGGMLDRGATTFWEEYKPEETVDQQYSMYGDPYGKSLCHAWGASPIYLIGRYFMGVRATDVAYRSFEAAPNLDLLEEFDCEFPVAEGTLRMKEEKGRLSVFTDKAGGVLRLGDRRFELVANETLVID